MDDRFPLGGFSPGVIRAGPGNPHASSTGDIQRTQNQSAQHGTIGIRKKRVCLGAFFVTQGLGTYLMIKTGSLKS